MTGMIEGFGGGGGGLKFLNFGFLVRKILIFEIKIPPKIFWGWLDLSLGIFLGYSKQPEDLGCVVPLEIFVARKLSMELF